MKESDAKETTTPCIKCKYFGRDWSYPVSCRYSPKVYSPVFGKEISPPSSKNVFIARRLYGNGDECSKWEKKRIRDYFSEGLWLPLVCFSSVVVCVGIVFAIVLKV